MVVQDGRSTTSTATIYDYFDITIKYECDDDVVSLTSDIGLVVYSTSSGAAQDVNANFAQTISGCAMIYKCEVYDGTITGGVTALNQISTATTSSWIEVPTGGGTGDLAWATAFNAGTLTVQTSTTYDPYQDFAVRVTYTSKYSQMPETDRTKIEYYIVRLTPSDTCIWNTLTKTTEIPTWQYIVSNANNLETKSPGLTRAVASCKIYQKLFFLNEQSQMWVDWSTNQALYPFASFADGLNTADTNVGRVSIRATRSMTMTPAVAWKPFKKYKVKVTLDDLDSNGLQMLTYIFDLEIRDICADDYLTKTALNDVYTYIYSAPSDLSITPVFAANVAASENCPTAATLEFWDKTTL